MSRLLIGAGGWAYLLVPNESSLQAYSRGFDFVEVNSSYYQTLSPRLLLRWRQSVPTGFQFSVRCNRKLAEQYCGRDKELDREGRETLLSKIKETCKILEANILAILLDDSGPRTVSGLESFFSDFGPSRSTRVAVEVREGHSPSNEFLRALERNDGIHCVDVSRGESPMIESEILYSRLFGKGEGNAYEFDDRELEGIAREASSPVFEKSILAFHGVRMYRDAARLKTFLATGSFPRLTGDTGLDAFEKVIEEDTVYPVTKQELLRRQGWKLFDLTEDRRVRTRTFLEHLPEEKLFLDSRMVRDHLEREIGQVDTSVL